MSITTDGSFNPEEENIKRSSPKNDYSPDYSLTISKDDELPESSNHPSFTVYQEENEEDLQTGYITMITFTYLLYIIKAFVCLTWNILPHYCTHKYCFGKKLDREQYTMAELGNYIAMVFGGYFVAMVLLKKVKIFNNLVFFFIFYIVDFWLTFHLYNSLIFQKYAYDRKERFEFRELRTTGFNFYMIVQLLTCSITSMILLLSETKLKKKALFGLYFGLGVVVGFLVVPKWGHMKVQWALHLFNFISAFLVALIMVRGEVHLKSHMVDSSNPFKLKDCFYFGNSLRFEVVFVMFGDLKRLFSRFGIEVSVP